VCRETKSRTYYDGVDGGDYQKVGVARENEMFLRWKRREKGAGEGHQRSRPRNARMPRRGTIEEIRGLGMRLEGDRNGRDLRL